jgi:hypothetical protein
VQRLLSEAEFTELEDELAKGAAGHGRHDSQWTLDRIRLLMLHQFIVRYTIRGVVALLKTPWVGPLPAPARTGVTGGGHGLGEGMMVIQCVIQAN